MPRGPGDADDSFTAASAEYVEALAEMAVARLAIDPAGAERILRRALAVGGQRLPRERRARLNSLVVTAISAQTGRDDELAEAALVAAASWIGLSAADDAHHTLLAARIHYRAGHHRAAARLYARALTCRDIPYPAPEIALLHEQFGTCLLALHRFRDAAREFTLGAHLVANIPDYHELREDLLISAAAAHSATESRLRGIFTRLLRRNPN
ncbi:hypothetical protein GZH49_29720 [Nocardia terpenica]|uniref:hypothetical protein n=1 Tax=Nocardia terpenica TaxID=455432 RepID=UPI002FE2CAF5